MYSRIPPSGFCERIGVFLSPKVGELFIENSAFIYRGYYIPFLADCKSQNDVLLISAPVGAKRFER